MSLVEFVMKRLVHVRTVAYDRQDQHWLSYNRCICVPRPRCVCMILLELDVSFIHQIRVVLAWGYDTRWVELQA